MSRVGKHPIPVPAGVTCQITGQDIHAKGKLGELQATVPEGIQISLEEGKVWLKPTAKTKSLQMLWGTSRNLVRNLVAGVHEGFKINLEIEGVGYRAAIQGKTLKLQLGYSHDIDFPIPDGIQMTCDKPTAISVFGINRQQVGQVAAEVCSFRPPEPYKGKGIRKEGQFILRKEGKKK